MDPFLDMEECSKRQQIKEGAHARDEEIKGNETKCTPYPFTEYVRSYTEGDRLSAIESGASNFIEPCHEFKAFTNTTEETKMEKFTKEVVRFGAACINSRTNGTIHFGVADDPHGKILGVPVHSNEKEKYDQKLRHAINQHFEHKGLVQRCIKPPRFVEVRNRDLTPSGKFVIEVDIVPHHVICKNELFHTLSSFSESASKKKRSDKQFYVRDGGSSTNLLAPTTFDKKNQRYTDFVANVKDLAKLRKQSEKKHLGVVKSHNQGFKLCQMITGGTGSLDRSYYKQYFIVTNKSYPVQLDSMRIFLDLQPKVVLDFDQESAENGMYEYIQKHSDEFCASEVLAEDRSLHFVRWSICQRFNIFRWICDHRASVQTAIPFLCQRDVFQKMRFLVVFLVLSEETDTIDPLVESFCTFYRELKGKEQILVICANERVFTLWKSLINTLCKVDISNRCIDKLSHAEINGTILSLLSENYRSFRFIPGNGGSRVLLDEKVERQLTTLDVLCVNQCEKGNEDQVTVEQSFRGGGQVSWWNFYFSEQPGSIPFVKTDEVMHAIDILIPDLCSSREACVFFNLFHEPRSGGTTQAKHILWALRGKFRCAVVRNNSADPYTISKHVMALLKCGCTEQKSQVPVLLMIDDFENMEMVFFLQQLIKKQCLENNAQSKSPQVILLNCMRSKRTWGPFDPTEDTIFIKPFMSDKQARTGCQPNPFTNSVAKCQWPKLPSVQKPSDGYCAAGSTNSSLHLGRGLSLLADSQLEHHDSVTLDRK